MASATAVQCYFYPNCTRLGVFACYGCKQNYCSEHTREHRHHLRCDMAEIMKGCDELNAQIQEQGSGKSNAEILERVNQWERESACKIQQAAHEIRQKMWMVTTGDGESLREKIEALKNELNAAQNSDGFYENDLNRWMQRLDELRHLLSIPQKKFSIEESLDTSPIVSRISLKSVPNDNSTSNTPCKQNGTIVPNQNVSNQNVPVTISSFSEDYNHDRYSSGKHTLRFKIDEFKPRSSVVFGIVSAKYVIEAILPDNRTFYGWTDNDIVRRAGVAEKNFDQYQSDFQANGLYQLTIDCEQKKIRFKNERTNQVYELDVDILRCPFPWQPNVRIITVAE